MLGDIVLAHGVCAAEAAEKGDSARRARRAPGGPRHAPSARLRSSRRRRRGRHGSARGRALARLGIADPYEVDRLMATRQRRRRRLAAVARHARPDLRRRRRSDACATRSRKRSTRPRTLAPGRRRPLARSSGRCCATCSISATAPPATSRHPRRHHRGPVDHQLRRPDRRLRRRRAQPLAGLRRQPRRRHRHDPHQGRVHRPRRCHAATARRRH